MPLSIIIPVGRDPLGLETTLASLKANSSAGTGIQILVCNDGGHGEIREICTRYPVVCCDIVPNRGSYYARNIGIGQAEHEFLGFLDAGVEVGKDWGEKVIEALRDAEYAAGPVRHPQTIRNGVELCQAWSAFPIREYFEKYGFGATANLAVRKSVFEQAGSFDDRLRSGGDREFGERIRRIGRFRQVYDENRFVLHPYRDFSGIWRKQLRTTMGIRHLALLYPERYSNDIPPLGALLKHLLPPRPKEAFPAIPTTIPELEIEHFSQGMRLSAYLIFYSLRIARAAAFLMSYRRCDRFEWSEDGSQRP